MKRILWSIIIMLILSFCSFPLQMEAAISYGHSKTMSAQAEDDTDDDALLKTTEHIAINYARHNKRVKIERKVKVVESMTANKKVVFHATPFNYNGILNETLKRDYSGEDPVSINL